ncbi:SDR family NAD(P)-dependent oxidoreductase [Nonomuraea insulae]|uniref:SDR family NAD(P)-dependent oxidoreductase n=1 Tax=Nonomuraea insulae TaxID=1616787 RepID=A0ABW1CLS9_9ACTN
MSELAGKVALVTGGSRGIGAAIALRLAQDGAEVAITYVNAAEEARAVGRRIEAGGARALVIKADFADAHAATAAVEQTVAELGRIDILVNNAAAFAVGDLAQVTPQEVDHVLAVNVRAAFLACQAAARHMDRGGRLINVGTCVAEHVPGPGMTLFAMSKSALAGLTKGLARDLGPRGITATVIHPGPIDTHANPADGPQAPMFSGVTALGRYGTVEDIAAAVAYLAGEGGRYVTGSAINVDGGFAA